MPVLVGVTVWFCVTIASPVAKSVLSGAFRRLIISLGFVTLKTVAGRIRQAEEEYRTVVELRDDHTKMSRLIVGALVPLCFCFVVVMLPIFYSVGTNTELPQWLFGTLAGVVGVGLRWLLEFFSAFNLVVKAADFARYQEFFRKQQKQLSEIRDNLERGLK